MTNPQVIEYVGYLASAFVFLSFLMKDVKRLRVINIVGCSFFTFYGVLGGYWPVVITNVAIAFVNGYHILKPVVLQRRGSDME
ncbi:hypothetical protein [Algivirga pacifica]|uniref:YgjV family protein n=1 Tax=Algivirga pacifica TaxID=1162670 RepID=A0ABP9DIB6_9BACT